VEVGYAYLHGGVASADREDLITRFREDPDCRVFLSTDAGGVGLNLQSASLMVNLDIPWNPAVLEQRIGRIYRLGQAENVTIINMVSASSIEERMLDILVFKSSLAQGILDPEGDDTIFMSESKFKKFMENVENLAGNGWEASDADVSAETDELERPDHAAEPELDAARIEAHDSEALTPNSKGEKAETTSQTPTSIERGPKPTVKEERQADISKRKPSNPSTPQLAPVPESPQELIRSGVNFFSGLAQMLSSPEKTQELVQSIVQTDAETGQTYLKIPVENAAVVENAVKLLGGLLAGLGR
jgi:superfamily II DNA/RNA helicase